MFRYFFLIIPALISCKPNAEHLNEGQPFSIEKISNQKEDDLSPTGVWETDIQYPQISKLNELTKKINREIEFLTTEFQCDESNGDKNFTATVTLATENLISIKFVDSWYCAGMPRSDGRTGALTYALNTGELININHELKSSTVVSFMENLNAKFKKALNEKGVLNDCPEPDLGYFYLTNEGIAFINESNNSETIQCEVEVFINSNEMKKYLKENSPLQH